MTNIRYLVAGVLLALSLDLHAQAISALPAASALAGTEVFPAVQSGATVKATAAQIRAYTLGNSFVQFTGPSSTAKTYTLPNASSSILTDNAAVTVAQGGTGRATGTTAYGLIAAGTTATGAQQTLAAGATTEMLVGGGTSALPVWTTATGTGAPVRGTAPTIAGGTHTALTGLGIRSTGAAFDLTLATSEALTAGRTLSIVMGDATRTVTLFGSTTVPVATQQLTFAGLTAARTITFPDAAITVARTDAGQTFTGTQAFGAVTGSTWNGNTWATGTGTLSIAAGKTLTASNTLTLAGTDSTTITFPSTSATVARTDAGQTFTGTNTFGVIQFPAGAAATPSLALSTDATTGFYGNGVLRVSASGTQTAAWQAGNYNLYNTAVTFLDAAGNNAAGLSRPSAATIQQSNATNSATIVNQTLQAHPSRPGTDTNTGGANYTITSGNGTGTGTPSQLILSTPVAVGSGSGAQTMTATLTLGNGVFTVGSNVITPASTGTRYLCISATGQVSSSASACSGT